MSQLLQTIQDAVKVAMKAQDKAKLSALRLIMAELKQHQIDQQVVLDDATVITILDKMAKQRRVSIEQYEQANRGDLVAVEQAELATIQSFLPQQLTSAEILKLINHAVSEVEGSGMKIMGQVMTKLKPQIQGRADAKQVSDMVKKKLLEE